MIVVSVTMLIGLLDAAQSSWEKPATILGAVLSPQMSLIKQL